jgi:hypothetical protein
VDENFRKLKLIEDYEKMNNSKEFAIYLDDGAKNKNLNFDDVIIEKALILDSVFDENMNDTLI